MADTHGVIIAPNECSCDDGCHVSVRVTLGMEEGGNSVGEEEDTTGRKMSAVGKRHSKCPRRLGEEDGTGADGGSKVGTDASRNKKKSAKTIVKDDTKTAGKDDKKTTEKADTKTAVKDDPKAAVKDDTKAAVEDGARITLKDDTSRTSVKDETIANTAERNNTKTAINDDSADVAAFADGKGSGEKEVVDNTKKRGKTAARKRKSGETGSHSDVKAGDTPDNPALVVEDSPPVKAKRQRKMKPAKNNEANSSECCEPKLKATKKRVRPKKQPVGETLGVATNGPVKEHLQDGVTNICKEETSSGGTDCKAKAKVAVKPKAKKKKAPKSENPSENGSVFGTPAVDQATETIDKPAAKQTNKKKKVVANEKKKNNVHTSNSDIDVASPKDVSPAKKKKLNKCAKEVNKQVVDAASSSAANNTQDVAMASDTTGRTGVADVSMPPHSDTKVEVAGGTATNNTEHSRQELKQQDCSPCNNPTIESAASPVVPQCERTEPQPKDAEPKGTASSEEDASRCFPCSHCPYRAKRKVQLRKHLGTHGVHQCAHCEFVCDSSTVLTGHMQNVHPDKYGRKKCKRCLRIIKMGEIEEHEVTCTGMLMPWACTLCSKEFKYECQLTTHTRAHLSDETAEVVKTHPCPHCEYSGHAKANLTKHLKTVHGTDRQKTVKCPECEKLFYTPSHMRKHLKLHSDEMPFACTVCTKAFRTARCLKRHSFVHMDSPAFVCSIGGCTMAFDKPALLKAHKLDCHKVPDGVPHVKQFKCSYPECEQAFYKKSHLTRHEVIHTGERKFICDWKDCGKAFRHSDNLRVHYRRHTNDKPMKCDKCNFTCRQKSSLQFHVKNQHETQPDMSSETKTAQDTPPKTLNDQSGVETGAESQCDSPVIPTGASITTGIAPGGVIRAAEMAPLVKTETQHTPNKVSHDVYDFHDSDDDDNVGRSIGLQVRQKTLGKSPPGGSLLNNSSFTSIRDVDQHRLVMNATEQKVTLQKDTAVDSAVKSDTAGKLNKKMPAKPRTDVAKNSGVANGTAQTKATSKKRKKKEPSSVEKKCEEVSSAKAKTEKQSVTPTAPTTQSAPTASPTQTTNPQVTTSSGSTAATTTTTTTTTKTTKKKAASKRSRKKKAAAVEEPVYEDVNESVERPSLQESANDSEKQVPHANSDVTPEVEDKRDSDVVPESVERSSVEVMPQQVAPSDSVAEWPSCEPRNTNDSDHTGQQYEAESQPAVREDNANGSVVTQTDDVTEDVTQDVTEDVTEEEANELLPSPATVSQLMSEKDVNELSMPSMAHGSPSLSVHSDFVNNVAMSPRTYNESPQYDGKCDDYEREKELEAATAEAESAIFDMPAITSQDQTKINDILDSQADLMPPASDSMLNTGNRSPFMLSGSAGNAYSNAAADSHDTYPGSVSNISYPVDAMSADKKPLSDDNADISQCYSGASSSYGGYASLPSVPERQSVLKSNPAAVSCNYTPPPAPPPQPAYQPLPSHSLYGSRTGHVLPPVASYSHVPNPSFLLDPNLLANGGNSKGLESLRSSEPAYVISRDGPQLPVSSSSSSSSNKALPISSCFPGGENYSSSAKDFFTPYFQDPSTMPLTHLPTAADQRLSYHRAPHRASFDFLPRVPATAAVLPGATSYPASVSESLAAAMNPAMNPQHAQPHWGVDDRAHPWPQPSPMLMTSDLNAARNPFSAGSSSDRAAELNFDPSVASRQLSKRSVPESTFTMPQSPATGPDPYGSMTSAYMGRAFNPAAAVAPSNYMMNMSSSMSSTQKQFEEAYRQSAAAAAAAHIADYRSLGSQAAVPDIYSRMAVNPALGLDKYYYTRREQMYRTQAIGAASNPFLAPPTPQTNSTPVSYASDYSCAQVMYAAAAQHSAAAYGFMGDKQYLMSSRKISEAVPMLSERPPDFFPARPSTTEAQDPYRHSVIYNMMSRYY